MLSHWMSWRCGASFSALILNWWVNCFQGGEQAFKVISELLSSRVSAKELPPEEELKRVMTSSMIEKFQEYKKLQSRGHKDFYSKVDKLLHIELLRCSVLPFLLRSFLSSHPWGVAATWFEIHLGGSVVYYVAREARSRRSDHSCPRRGLAIQIQLWCTRKSFFIISFNLDWC